MKALQVTAVAVPILVLLTSCDGDSRSTASAPTAVVPSATPPVSRVQISLLGSTPPAGSTRREIETDGVFFHISLSSDLDHAVTTTNVRLLTASEQDCAGGHSTGSLVAAPAQLVDVGVNMGNRVSGGTNNICGFVPITTTAVVVSVCIGASARCTMGDSSTLGVATFAATYHWVP